MAKTKKQRLQKRIELVLLDYRWGDNPLRSDAVRRRIAKRIAEEIEKEVKEWEKPQLRR